MTALLRVLVVEDSEDDAALVVRELRRGGYEVTFERVDTPSAMQAALDRQDWDLVTADYAMPHFSAPAALAVIQERGLDLPFIIVSGIIGEETAVEAMRVGAHDYLMKGNLKRLVATVEREVREVEVRRARRQAEEALQQSTERLNSILQSLHDVVWSGAMDGTILYLSPATEKIYGRSMSQFFENPNLWLEVVHPEDRTLVEKGSQVLQETESNDLEYRILRPDGTVRWVHDRAWVIHDASGAAIRMDGIIKDITERKRGEEALRESEQLARTIVSSVSEGIIVYDRELRYRVWNKFMEELTELPADQVIGSFALDLFPHLTEYGIDRLLRRALAGEVVTSPDTPYRVPQTGKTGWVVGTYSPHTSAGGEIIGVVGVIRDITQRKQAEEAIQLQVQRLGALRDIDMAISASLDLSITLNVLLDKVVAQLQVDAADVLLVNSSTQTLEYAAGRGFRTAALQHTRLRLGEGHAGRVALERRMVNVPNLALAAGELSRAPLLAGEEFMAYYGVPLIAKGQVKGVLEIFHRAPLHPDPEWLEFLETLAGQAAIAIDNATLFNDLQRSNLDLTVAYDATLEGWSRALDLRDKETEGHTQRVTEMTVRLARAMGVRDRELVHVRRGALLHDMGKLGIPDNILLKPGPLSDEEWVIMRKHPVYVYEMLSPIPYLRPALDIPYSHHEKWDGSGYSRGLKGEEIPLAARIFAVADVWDALCSDRPYRPAWSEEKALAYIQDQSGKHFDPKVVEVFLGLESAAVPKAAMAMKHG